MNKFALVFLLLGIAVLVVELIGVFRAGTEPDTISQFWWYIQGRFPVGSRVIYVAAMVWLSIHLLFHDTDRPPSIEPPVELVSEEGGGP